MLLRGEYFACRTIAAFECAVHRPVVTVTVGGFPGEEKRVVEWAAQLGKSIRSADLRPTVRTAREWIRLPIVKVVCHQQPL